MTKLTELIASQHGPFHTYEFFPPRTEQGFANLIERIRRLTQGTLRAPLAVSVTWGAGGSTADRTMELAERIVRMGVEVILHLTCTNMPKEKVDQALLRAKALGVSNILALRGDPPRSEEYALDPLTEPDFFQHADDLVRYIRQEHGNYFCIGVAGYPTPHVDSTSQEDDIQWLKVKCDAGADFIITQLFYDVEGFENWVKACRDNGIDQPIIPGVMPIQNYASFRRLVKLTGAPVPPSILVDLESIRTDDSSVKRYGAELATKMVRRLLQSGTVSGVHLCTLNLEQSVRIILENLGWLSDAEKKHASPRPVRNRLIENDDQHGANTLAVPMRKEPSTGVANLSISPREASQLAQWGLSRNADGVKKLVSGNVGAPSGPTQSGGGEDSWDEYPNGRFTDIRSPAYGEIDGWGSGLKINAAQALKDWGTPASFSELSAFFTRYLNSDPSAPSTPFCDLPLSAESLTILPELLELNSEKRQCWTVGSQPAVDAANSEDPTTGWGPLGGYVFQKAFVEFFARKDQVEKLDQRLRARSDDLITMYAGNKKGDFRTNSLEETVNAVTWGVFPGQEIVQSTIIEKASFLAWKEEAFDIWTEWSQLYPRTSPARQLLQEIADDWWLVSLIHHDFKDEGALWRFVLEEQV